MYMLPSRILEKSFSINAIYLTMESVGDVTPMK